MDFFRPLAQSISRRPLPPLSQSPSQSPSLSHSTSPTVSPPTPTPILPSPLPLFSLSIHLSLSVSHSISLSAPPPPFPAPTRPFHHLNPARSLTIPTLFLTPPPPPHLSVNVLYPWHYQGRRFSPLPTELLTSETVSILATNATITFQGRSFSNYQGALESVLKEKRRRNIDRDGENARCSMMMKSQCTFPPPFAECPSKKTPETEIYFFFF